MGITVSHALSMTSPANTLYENGPANWNSAHAVSIDASLGLNTAFTNVTATANSSGLSINAAGYAGTGFTGTNATATFNSAGLAISAGGGGIGLNTAGTNITWTANSSGLSINAGGYAGTATGATGASITANSGGISINVPAAGGATMSSFQNIVQQSANLNLGNTTSYAAAFVLPQAISFSYLRLPCSFTQAADNIAANVSQTTGNGFIFTTWNAVIYTYGTGANSQSLRYYTSTSDAWTYANTISYGQVLSSTQYSVTQKLTANAYGSNITVGTSTQYSQSAASVTLSTGFLTNFSGNRFVDINFAASLSAGGPYWLVFGMSTSATSSGQGGGNLTRGELSCAAIFGLSQGNNVNSVAGDTSGSYGTANGAGSFTTNAAGTTASLANSNITVANGNFVMQFQLLRSA